MKRNEVGLVFIIIASLLITLSSCSEKVVFTESDLEFKISVPVEWQYQEDISDSIRYYALSPLRKDDVGSGQTDSIKEDLIITREYYAGASLEDYYYWTIQVLKALTTNYDSLSTEDMVINGNDCKQHIHLQTVLIPRIDDPEDFFEVDLKMIRYVFLRGDYGYTISCASPPDTYDHYKPIFDFIVSTFEFKE